jgi:hypothetical protein
VPVVKVHGFGTSPDVNALPAKSLAPVVIVHVNRTPFGRLPLNGVNVAVVPVWETIPVTGVRPGPVTLKVSVVSVSGSIASLNVTWITWLTGTALAPSAGTVELTVGETLSAAEPVVKVNEKSLAIALPARS